MTIVDPIPDHAPLAVAVFGAIQAGDVAALRQLLADNPGLATARIVSDGTNCGRGERSLLHVATDWPGHFPRVAETIAELVRAGADVDARFVGAHAETPLHWAASCDDVAALDALLEAGADMEATGGVIDNGTPLADARVFRQWKAAERLVECGAKTDIFDEATLGLLQRLQARFGTSPLPDAGDVSCAFWGACHGDRRDCAEYLLEHGAELNWVADWEPMTPLDAAVRSGADGLAQWLRGRGAKSASVLPRSL